MCLDLHVAVERCQGLAGRLDLLLADMVEVVEDLPLQVGGVDAIEVDDPDRADPGGGQVEGHR